MKKVNIDREDLSSEEINKHKNFKNIIGNAYKIPKPLYKTPKFFGGLIIILAVATVLILEYTGQDKKLDETNESSSFITPPIEKLDIKDSTYSVDAENGDTIIHSSGSKIIVPKDAFVDENGNSIKGKVEIKYREFHTQTDIFFSGIPMGYDSGGTKFQFESAGMCEMKGLQNNKAIFIDKQKSLIVNLPTKYDGPGYNMYYLDTVKKNWQFTGKDSINNSLAEEAEKYFTESKDEKKSELAKCAINYISAKKEVKKIVDTKPTEPIKASAGKESFAIEVDESDFPEIAVYKDVLFEIADNKKLNKSEADIEWNDVVLQKIGKKGDYHVKFISESKTAEYNVIPVFEGKSFENAQKIFEKKFSSYQHKLEEKKEAEIKAEQKLKEEIAKQKQEREKFLKEFEAQRIKDSIEYVKLVAIAKVEAEKQRIEEEKRFAANKKQMEEEIRKADALTKVTRTFQANRFGIINCDNPGMYPSEMSVSASFENSTNKNLNLSRVYLVQKENNTVFTYYSTDEYRNNSNKLLSNFTFNPAVENIIWAVIDSEHIGIVREEKLKGTFNNGESISFEMEIVSIKNSTASEIEKILGI